MCLSVQFKKKTGFIHQSRYILKIPFLSENKEDQEGGGSLKRIYKPQFEVNFAPYVNLKWLETNTSALSRDFLSGKDLN